MMKPVRVSAPSSDPVSLAEFKTAARVDFVDDDEILQSYLAAAVGHLDGWTGILGRAIINQDWRIDLPCWPACQIVLPFGDVSAVAVAYTDDDGADQTLPTSHYELVEIATGSLVRYRQAFTSPALDTDRSDAVRVTFTTGFGANASDVPAPIRVAIMQLAAHWYENREAAEEKGVQSVPMSVDRLITPYRRVFF